MDDYYVQKMKALRDAEEKWNVIRRGIEIAWILILVPPLIWLVYDDASATHYIALGVSWLFCRWLTIKLFVIEYVVKVLEKIECDFPKHGKTNGTVQD
jgi:hypothetical protein